MSWVRRPASLGLLLIILYVSFSIACRKADAVGSSPLHREAEQIFVSYLQIDTSNPPGGETSAARFLQQILVREGVEARLIGRDPQRQSLYARLSSGTTQPALLLLHHMDVVPANPSEWSIPPFSGKTQGGYIWGRGALDSKSLGVAELMAFLDLKRRGVQLRRDVILLAVADEERGGIHGLEPLLMDHPELFRNVGFVLNEGGSNLTVVDHVTYWGIEFDQKVPLWLRLTVRGQGGHASSPPDDGGASSILVQLLSEVQKLPQPNRLVPSVQTYLRSASRARPGLTGTILQNPVPYLDKPEVLNDLPRSYRTLLHDTIALTTLEAGDSVNSIPATASGELDIRLLPGSDPEPMLTAIRQLADGKADVEVLLRGAPVPPSPLDTELYRVLARNMGKAEPKALVGPMVISGTTDSRLFRARGIVAYGVLPFKVNYYDADSAHGVDERIRQTFFFEGIDLMREIVRDFCAAPS